jgi:transposase
VEKNGERFIYWLLYYYNMFLKITTKKYGSKIYRHASLVETLRIKGKVVQKYIKNIGVLNTDEDEKKAKQLIEIVKQGKKLVILDEVNEKVLEYGVRLAVKSIWQSISLSQFFNEAKKDINQIIYMLIAHRLHNYGSCNISEREGCRWIKEESYTTLKDIDLHQFYRSLFILFSKKEPIEKHLCKTLNNNKRILFYDLTSSYVEGDYADSEIIKYGYNRDKKKGKEQIVIGLLLAEGLPLAHKVWEGNTPDKTTLHDAVTQAKELGVTNFVFVADRGLITDKNILWLEDQKLEYIIATKRRNDKLISSLMENNISEKVTKVHEEGRRIYYLCFNEESAKEQIDNLNEIKKKSIEKINSIKNPTEHKILEAVGKAKRLFTFSFEKGFNYSLNKSAWDYENKIAGKYILVTNNHELDKEQICTTYKELIDVEQCFGELKHFEDMRPFFHKSDNGLKAHVFLCVLTLLIERIIKKKVNDMSQREVITELKKIKLCKVKDNYVRTDITQIQKDILFRLGIEVPPKVM